jgi:hypothetical protein
MECLLAIMEKFKAKMKAHHEEMMAMIGAEDLSGEAVGNSRRNEVHSRASGSS